MKFLRNPKILLSLILVIVIAASAVAIVILKGQNKKALADKDAEIERLQTEVAMVGEMISVYALTEDVVANKPVEDNDLVLVSIPSDSAGNVITDIEALRTEKIGDAVNKSLVYKMDLAGGTILTKEMLSDYTLTDDLRYYDIVLNQYFVGMTQGSYFDIRYASTKGEDSIVISHTRAEQVNNGVPKIIVNEKDILAYRSALIESVLTDGYLYAVEYVESGLQKPAETFYITKPYLASLMNDKGLENDIKAALASNGHSGDYDEYVSGSTEEERKTNLESLKERINSKFTETGSTVENAQSAWQNEQERIAQEQAEAEAMMTE